MQPLVLSAGTLTGDKIRNPQGEDLGSLKEIMLDVGTGHIAYAVVSFGGFLGMGNKLFAIPWRMLTVDTENKELVLDVDKSVLENAPGFDKDNWPNFSDRTWGTQIYSYYNYDPYWE
ncbi:MAG: PRC-barrel domain-containing protein [Chloroflexota bacterium]|jgi:sporulation protein YlmC with PRC-barrel domain|nr:PRC-barrel domain-containing protein [Anaerolineae bacterium]HMM28393.1 PRC-barrel domain-containing protein [Aggregatilineaceae bacterium]